MLLYPQLVSGAVAQFPLRRSYSWAHVTNLQEDGSRYSESATENPFFTWQLRYDHLTLAEAEALKAFFESTRGRLGTFTFLDPAGNLLAWSEDLSKPFWESSAGLAHSEFDSESGPSFDLSSAGSATLSQTVPCPATALLCWSMLARANQPNGMQLALWDASGRVEQTFSIDGQWRRIFVTQQGTGASLNKTVEVSLLAGSQAQVAHLCLSAQPAPGAYAATSQLGGIYPNARFDQDALLVIASGPNDFSCAVQLTTRLS